MSIGVKFTQKRAGMLKIFLYIGGGTSKQTESK
jgi:hypothetical protein